MWVEVGARYGESYQRVLIEHQSRVPHTHHTTLNSLSQYDSPPLNLAYILYLVVHNIAVHIYNDLQKWRRYEAQQGIILARQTPSADLAGRMLQVIRVPSMRFGNRRARLKTGWIRCRTLLNRMSPICCAGDGAYSTDHDIIHSNAVVSCASDDAVLLLGTCQQSAASSLSSPFSKMPSESSRNGTISSSTSMIPNIVRLRHDPLSSLRYTLLTRRHPVKQFHVA